jgi:hypothetical protein
MKNLLLIAFVFATVVSASQTKKAKPVVQDSVTTSSETLQLEDAETEIAQREFKIYTKRSKDKNRRLQLCINLVSGDSVLNYRINDSLLRDPEKYKVLFEKTVADTMYFLIYAAAFTKDLNKPECAGGREVKLYFIKWNTANNKATHKQKYIESCQKTITQLSDEPIDQWNGESELYVRYHRALNFYELRFDPKNFQAGIISKNDIEDN